MDPEIVREKGALEVAAPGRSGQMLVIDNNMTVQDVLSRSLSSLGHNLSPAGNGLVGETLFLISPHDLVIIDLQMPLMNIWELSRILKDRSRRILSS